MYRQLYQMGGIGTLPMDYGQPLQVPQQPQPNFSSAQNITMNPLLNYGQTPLTMAGGGISRLGYQEGDMAMMEDQAMMQPQMQQPPLEGIMGAIPQDAGMMQQEGGTEQTALLTIIQLLIEQGIPPEQAQELAMQILQVFAQGGQPAVEEFANQLEQEEGMPENRTMMAGGGITGLYPRQGYFFKGVVKAVSGAVKGVAKAVKSVAKSPIGQIALAVAAPYVLGPAFGAIGLGGNVAGSAFLGGAIRTGLSNLVIQGLTTGKFNPKQALLAAAAGGALSGFQGAPSGGINPDVGGIPDVYQPLPTTNLTSGVVPASSPGAGALFATGADVAVPTVSTTPTDLSTVNFSQAAKSVMDPTIGDRFSQGLDYLKSTATNFAADPLTTIGRGITNVTDFAKKNPEITLAATTFGLSALAQQPGETDEEYSLRAQRDANVAAYITQYGRGSKLYSPTFYSMEKAIDPFAGLTTYAANGGRIGFEYGSMPMGEPRRNPAGIMELDYRKKGGFVPPVGIKEKADDIPAMLSNNEFVFTADAVRNAGGGDVDRGAQRMYSLMKNLENGGRV